MLPLDDSPRTGAANTPPQPQAGWARVKALFLEALDRSPAEREAYLAQACAGDAALRAEVQSLLDSDEAASDFCESPAGDLLARSGTAGQPSQRLQPGVRLGAYEILSFVAAGGMGEVYRARHTLLERDVAIKVVSGRSADPVAGRRLLREARNASVLSHPNICRIYEVGDAGDVPFIAMEFAEGRPLAELLREGPLPLARMLDLGCGVADALAHAHQRRTVHRDLKSANVVVHQDGHPIVLDFGLARRLRETEGSGPSQSTVTQQGAMAGTLSHMAPEILLGGDADRRSDIWSLGVLLFEMVAGTLPFPGRTPFETTSAVLNDAPVPLPRSVPLALRLVIDRCLAKDPARRYQGAAEVRSALEAIRARRAWALAARLSLAARPRLALAAAAALLTLPGLLWGGYQALEHARSAALPLTTLALFPLETPAGDAGARYYAAGVGDALSAQLGAASDLRLFSPGAVAHAGPGGMRPSAIGRRLGADALLQGSVRRDAQRVVLDLRLLRTADEHRLWSRRLERPPRDVLALEADAVRAIIGATHHPVSRDADDRLTHARAVSPEVYEEYLKGKYEWSLRTPASLRRAVEHFTAAVGMDPSYAAAHAALADCYNQFGTVMLGGGSPRQWRPRAAAEAIKALQLDPYSAEAHAALAYAWHYDWRWKEAEREFRRSLELNPSLALAHVWYGNLLTSMGRQDEALRQEMLARGLDPFSLVVNANVGWTLLQQGRFAEAAAEFRKVIALDSTYTQAHWRLAWTLAMLGQNTEALAEARRLVLLSNRSAPAVGLLAEVDFMAGRTAEARALLAQLLERAQREYVPPATLSPLLARAGRTEEALVWAQRAIDERSNAMVYLNTNEAGPLPANPRFQAMLARAGHP